MRWVIVSFVASNWNSHFSHEGRLIVFNKFDWFQWWFLAQILFRFYLILHYNLSFELLLCYSSHLLIITLFSISTVGRSLASFSRLSSYFSIWQNLGCQSLTVINISNIGSSSSILLFQTWLSKSSNIRIDGCDIPCSSSVLLLLFSLCL